MGTYNRKTLSGIYAINIVINYLHNVASILNQSETSINQVNKFTKI